MLVHQRVTHIPPDITAAYGPEVIGLSHWHRHARTKDGRHLRGLTGWCLTYPSEKYESQLG
jgi:hypothetical protein